MADLDWGRIVNIGGGAILVLLGIWVATRRPFRRENLAFGMFSAGLGLFPALFNLSKLLNDNRFTLGFAYPDAVAVLICAIGLVLVALWFPTPVTRSDRFRLLAGATAGAAIYGVAAVLIVLTIVGSLEGTNIIDAPAGHPMHYAHAFAQYLYYAAAWFALIVFPLRFAATTSATQRSSYTLMASAVVLYPAFNLPVQTEAYRQLGRFPDMPFATVVVAILAGLLWLANTRLDSHRKQSRNVALLTIALPAAGLAIGTFDGSYDQLVRFGVFGLLRIVTAAILAYAILKHQLLGIDVKVRFAISKTTLAGIFIAVFFVGSETAQQFFGQRLGGPYFGIIAAGALVFVLAPLSRMADRLAEKAVPVAAPAGTAVAPSSRESAYLDAVHLALRDRRLTRAEETKLHGLAEQLGIGAKRAHEILVQAESEAGVA